MKKTLFTLIICIAMPMLSLAQLPSDAIFQKYAKKEGVDATAISGFMIKPLFERMSAQLNEKDKNEALNYLKSVSSIGIVQTLNDNSKLAKTIFDEANQLVKKGKYIELMSGKQQGVNFKVFSHKSGDTTKEILGYGGDGKQTVLITIQGEFTEDMIKRALAKATEELAKAK